MLEQTVRKTLVSDVDLSSIEVTDQNKVLELLEDSVVRRVHLYIAQNLSVEDNARLIALLDEGSPAEVEQFIVERLPDVSEQIKNITQSTVAEFKTLLG